MYATRAISLAMVLLGSLAVKAAPMPAVRPDHVDPGTVMRAMPLHFHPPLPGNSVGSGAVRHPVIALSHPNADGYVPVVAVSHNHPGHMAETHAAYHYDLHTHDAGMGQFQRGSRIAIGHPTHVHVNDLHHVAPGPDPHNPHASFMPSNLHPQDTHELRHAVHETSGHSFNNPPHPEAPPPWRVASNRHQ